MGLFSFITGKTPEEIELVGDKYFKINEFGSAKLEYEKALDKAQAKFPEKENLIRRLKEKITDSRESLARTHLQNSAQLTDPDNFSEAEDLLRLALELTEKADLQEEIKNRLKKLHAHLPPDGQDEWKMKVAGSEPFPTSEEIDDDDEYFSILCNALPDDVRKAYQGYDHAFKQGYVALNNGDFEIAVEKFTDSINQFGDEHPLVPLELATAWVHMEQYDRAGGLLEEFIEKNRQEIRAYQMLCDIYWVTENYDNAVALITQCPAPLNQTFPIRILLGETYYHMNQYEDAEALFLECENNFGQNEIITRSLAKTYEAMGKLEKARDIYGRILNGCTKCGVRPDPFLQQRYAELCFACGERSSRLVEIYLSLLQEDPDNKVPYYQRIYELYDAMGNQKEADRYQSFIRK